jgi:formyltetrahydrofolate-dependent phosphoribosylglycinamide formyltransferase
MFDRLKTKWKVGGLQLALILCTFAIGGSLTGYAGRKLMNLFAIDQRWLWVIIYIVLITLLWPVAVLLVSFPFGQFRFFINYLKKIGRRMKLVKTVQPVNIALFASGAGSNAQKIIDYFRHSSSVSVALIVCNKPGAGVISIAEKEKIPVLQIDKEKFFRGDAYTNELVKQHIHFIVLAGFLWKVPQLLLKTYRNRIINIHPALLPKYGGKGMYGSNVHQAVIDAKEKESGITIHYVDEVYDHGDTIFQARCEVYETDTPQSLAQRIHHLEHQHYPEQIEKLLRQL